jgi:hypothetical protein
VFMANVAEVVLIEHERQKAHLHDPQAVWMHDLPDIGDKFVWVLQIVEHGDGSDDFGATILQFGIVAEGFRCEEAGYQPIGNFLREHCQVFGGVDTDSVDTRCVVRCKQSTVIAADVQHCFASLQLYQLLCPVSNIG